MFLFIINIFTWLYKIQKMTKVEKKEMLLINANVLILLYQLSFSLICKMSDHKIKGDNLK